MRLIRSFKRTIIKSTHDHKIHILFYFNTYDLYDSSITISKHIHNNKIIKRLSNEPNYWVHYRKHIDNMIYGIDANKFFNYSYEYYFVNKCLIKSISCRYNNYTYEDYEYEKIEGYNFNPKVKNSIINKIRNSKLYQFIMNIITK